MDHEEEYLTTKDPQRLLAILRPFAAPLRAHARQWRLFACAFCRRYLSFWPDPSHHAHELVRLAEKMADNEPFTPEEYRTARASPLPIDHVTRVARWCLYADPARAAARAETYARRPGNFRHIDGVAHCAIIRCIAGNPFRTTPFPARQSCCEHCQGTMYVYHAKQDSCRVCGGTSFVPVTPPPFLTPTAIDLANACYANLASGALDTNRLLVLADCLEEAGCPPQDGRTTAQVIAQRRNAVMGGCCNHFGDFRACDCLARSVHEGVLEHLRSPGPHARGCWAVDFIRSYSQQLPLPCQVPTHPPAGGVGG